MQKYGLYFVGFILILFLCNFNLKLNANQADSWEYFPRGDNYLDPNNFIVDGGDNNFYVETINNFRIKPNQVYSLLSTHYQSGYIEFIQVTFYDENMIIIEYHPDYFHYFDGIYINGTSFTSPANAYYMNLYFEIIYVDQGFLIFDPIDEFFVLCEGTNYPHPLYYTVRYLGPNCEFEMVNDGEVGYYLSNVDNPVPLSTIKQSIRAYDDVDGDLTNQIIVIEDNYTPNQNVLGQHHIIFEVSDNSYNTASFTLIVIVYDITPPQIFGFQNYTVKETELKSQSFFINNLIVIDNYDNLTKHDIYVIEDNYTENYNIQGNHTMVFGVDDLSGNTGTYEIYITVIDGIPPQIIGPTSINKPNNNEMTLDAILLMFSAYDLTDGDVTDKITVLFNNYSPNSNRIGRWQITLQCRDQQNNLATHILYIEVFDQTIPVFFVDKKTITIDLSENLTIDDFIGLLIQTKVLSQSSLIVINVDEYSENKNTPGIYKIVLGVDDSLLELEVKVVDGLYDQLRYRDNTHLIKIIYLISSLIGLTSIYFITRYLRNYKIII